MPRVRYVAVNCFLVFHILTITCWCAPVDNSLIILCRRAVRPYFLWAGLFQSWDMFAPTPKAANTYLEATLVYRDGSRSVWKFPRMEKLTYTQRYFKERYRKFADSLQLIQNDDLLPDVARYIARLNSGPARQVKTVILIENWSPIVARSMEKYAPEPWQHHVLLGYGVRPADLQ